MKISENISLGPLNSFGVDGRARRLVEWESAAELARVDFSEPWMALGGGNNVLFTTDYDGTLVKSVARGIAVTGETAETVRVRAEAGVDWDDFVAWCVERGFWGVENLSAIPGTVGAAPIQNIGAYGAEVGDVVVAVECFCVETGGVLTLAREHCGFGYRSSVFKGVLRGRVVVTAVEFGLSKEPRPNLKYAVLAERVAKISSPPAPPAGETTTPQESGLLVQIRGAVMEIRSGKLPDVRVLGNAGSFFKNPAVSAEMGRLLAERYPAMPVYPTGEGGSKLSAGGLIEAAGWRGRSVGRVGIHRDQALVVVNLGGATGEEIVEFARRVQDDVRAKFGVDLEPEVNVLPQAR